MEMRGTPKKQEPTLGTIRPLEPAADQIARHQLLLVFVIVLVIHKPYREVALLLIWDKQHASMRQGTARGKSRDDDRPLRPPSPTKIGAKSMPSLLHLSMRAVWGLDVIRKLVSRLHALAWQLPH